MSVIQLGVEPPLCVKARLPVATKSGSNTVDFLYRGKFTISSIQLFAVYFLVMILVVVIFLCIVEANTEAACPITPVNGFMKRVCGADQYQCMISTNVTYTTMRRANLLTRMPTMTLSRACPNDPSSFQACGLGYLSFTNPSTFDFELLASPPYCGYVCPRGKTLERTPARAIQTSPCMTKQDESFEVIELEGGSVSVGIINGSACDLICDDIPLERFLPNIAEHDITNFWCFDEVECGGRTYGIKLSLSAIPGGGPALKKANGTLILVDGVFYIFDTFPLKFHPSGHLLTVFLCFLHLYNHTLPFISFFRAGPPPTGHINNTRTCDNSEEIWRQWNDSIWEDGFPLFNGSRCFPFQFRNPVRVPEMPYCKSGLDQTNCSDPTRVAGRCLIRGYPSTVSTLMTCLPGMPGVCDDGLDLKCVELGELCRIHRHKTCDGKIHCQFSIDENKNLCGRVSQRRCKRNFGDAQTPLKIPFGWVNDGVIDCVEGEDEDINWKSCGSDITWRYTDSTCEEVFLCGTGRVEKFKELKSVCGMNMYTCEKERAACSKSMGVPEVSRKLIIHGHLAHAPFCLPGLESSRDHLFKAQCRTMTLFDKVPFGVKPREGLIDTKSYGDCRYLYGEPYTFAACNGLCGVPCPRNTSIHVQWCTNIRHKVYTLDKEHNLTMVIPSKLYGYHDEYFPCANGRCVPFENTCDLQDHCGDGSDENQCFNNFQCRDGRKHLPLTQKCNGKIECHDLSDECNGECSVKLVQGDLIVWAWGIGVGGCILNVYSLYRSIKRVSNPSIKTSIFIQQSMMQLICLGDLMTSGYLLVICFYSMIWGERFCVKQLDWSIGYPCQILGIMITSGSCILSVSMATLSGFRVHGTLQSVNMQRSEAVEKRTKCVIRVFMVTCILGSLLIGIVPLLPFLEDSFVNGLSYSQNIGLFLGSVSKDHHVEVALEYFGKSSGKVASNHQMPWSTIRTLVADLFSKDVDGVTGSRVSFYASHPGCQFKYFVTPNDPQILFVWFTLAFHALCFMTVILAHVSIAVLVSHHSMDASSSKNLILQRKVSLIVVTETMTWIPFLTCCMLHTGLVVDMSPYYPIFSLVILPLNSVLNPILYSKLGTAFIKFTFQVENWLGKFVRRGRSSSTTQDQGQICSGVIEMHVIENGAHRELESAHTEAELHITIIIIIIITMFIFRPYPTGTGQRNCRCHCRII
eukprot:sb/3461242/